MSGVEELTIADVRRIKVEPGDVILLQFDEMPTSDTGIFEPLNSIEEFMRRIFPTNRTVIIDGKTKLEVRSAEPDWDLITRKVMERMAQHAARA